MGDERNPDRRRATIVGENGYPMFVGPPWSVVGANDMDRNGYADVVWHNSATGETQLWLMNGTRIARRVTVLWENGAAALVGLPWSIVVRRFQHRWQAGHPLAQRSDKHDPDLVHGHLPADWTRDRAVGGQRAAYVGWVAWHITGTNDFDRDKIADVLWHNEWTGETQIWLMTPRAIKSRLTVDAAQDGGGALVSAPWRIMRH